MAVANSEFLSPDIEAERALRLEVWAELVAMGAASVRPARVRDLEIYAGQAGVYADKARTKELTPDGAGIAVSVVHRGNSYADDLSEDGLLYHYPKTNRSPAHDAGEIQALKWAFVFELPIFTITQGAVGDRRSVHLSWIEDVDDDAGLALIAFGELPTGPARSVPGVELPFFLTASEDERRALRKVRIGQQRFSFDVFRRYGYACAVCSLALPELLDAAHICAKGHGGSSDARNGLPLCVLHHRAYDRGFWGIDPVGARLVTRSGGPTLAELHIPRTSLAHLPALPHSAALDHGWAEFAKHR